MVACSKVGAVLPAAVDYEILTSFFERDGDKYLTVQGRKDLWAIFPDMMCGSVVRVALTIWLFKKNFSHAFNIYKFPRGSYFWGS